MNDEGVAGQALSRPTVRNEGSADNAGRSIGIGRCGLAVAAATRADLGHRLDAVHRKRRCTADAPIVAGRLQTRDRCAWPCPGHTPPPLRVRKNSRFVRLEHLTVRFGGARTVLIQDSSDVLFDHVRVLAGNDGAVLSGHSERITFAHCEFRGGVPTWMFRSDIKDVYRFATGAGVETDNLGARTSDVLLGARPESTNTDTLIHHCEFVDGHDLLLFGHGTRFHHNWIRNCHDDALIIGANGVTDLEVHHNLITQSLTALSMVSGDGGGPRRVHHNLFDLREPTAGIRPHPPGHLVDKDDEQPEDGVFRSSLFYKADAPDGPLEGW